MILPMAYNIQKSNATLIANGKAKLAKVKSLIFLNIGLSLIPGAFEPMKSLTNAKEKYND